MKMSAVQQCPGKEQKKEEQYNFIDGFVEQRGFRNYFNKASRMNANNWQSFTERMCQAYVTKQSWKM